MVPESSSHAEAPPTSAVQAGSLRIIVRCLSYLRAYWRLVVGSYIALLAIAGLALVLPQIIRWGVDQGMGAGNLSLLGQSVLAILACSLVKGALTFQQGRWTETASQGVAYDLRNQLYSKLAALSFSYHDRALMGQLLSRAIQDVDRVRFLTGRAILRLAEGSVLLIGTAIVLFTMNPRLTLLALAAMPVLAYRALRFSRRFRPLSLAVQQQLAVLTTRLEQNLRGARVVKAFAQEDAEIARFACENKRWFEISARSARLESVQLPILDLIANLGIVVIIWYGGRLVIQGQLTLGEMVAFTTYLSQLFLPVRRLGMILPAVAMASTAGERVFEILDAVSEVRDAPDAQTLPAIAGHVHFERVSFGYTQQYRVLEDISFEARPGQMIALLGPTGSGKSSITNLIPRFYDATGGRITVDGYDITSVTLSSLRDQIGIVLQEPILFATSLSENIAFGRPGATEAEIIAAAKAAQAHDFIMATPHGYNTPIGERGVTLSGGQKQRITIARVLLKDPRILILDDATSSVDVETEWLIQLALEQLMHGRTSFVIAHRLSTVHKADLILVLDKGRIVARGAHAELLRTSPIYSEIYYRQLQPQGENRPAPAEDATR